MKQLGILLGMILLVSRSIAQPYGDEWIRFDQSYFKVFVGQEGMYRIKQEDLKAAGVPVESINPRGVQIFWRGEEQHIWVEGEADGSFDPGDFIEFYGTYNDGAMDRELYRTPQEQPHTYMSLYQDSSVYFITWNNAASGKRMREQNDLDFSGLNPDPWFLHESVMWFSSQWFDGAPFADLGFYSEYTEGEGWMSSNVVGSYRSFNLSTPFYNSSGPQPKAYVLAFGKSDPVNPSDFDQFGNNHEFEVSVGWSTTLQVLQTRRHRGYTRLEFSNLSIPTNTIGALTRFNFRSVFGARGRHAVSLIKMQYPRNFDLGNSSKLSYAANAANTYFQWNNYPAAKTQPLVYDMARNERIQAVLSGNQLRYKRAGSDSGLLVISDVQDVVSLTDIRPAIFTDYGFSTTSYNYLIITHTSLDSGAQVYKQYRESAEGGGHKVLLAYADRLYDQYRYGIHHPLALKKFANRVLNEQKNKPDFFMLLGKGQKYNRVTFNSDNRNIEDLVPTYGFPPTDLALTSGLNSTLLEPAIPTGRVPARRNDQIISYLDKVKSHENLIDLERRKEVVHLAGGVNSSENSLFKTYLRNYGQTLSSPYFGGNVTLFSKSDAVPVETGLTKLIQNEISKGVSMVTYFGHGSAQVLEVDIGQASSLTNKGHYPLFYFNGCALADCFEQFSIPESFLFQDNSGCVSWIASTSFGFTSELNRYCQIFHRNAFDINYGKSIGSIQLETIKEYQNVSNPYNISQCRQLIYLGDPALKLFSPDKPDYTIQDKSIKIVNPEINTSEKLCSIVIENRGKALINDTLEVLIILKNANSDTISLPLIYIQNVHYKKEQIVKLLNPKFELKGFINLEVIVDPFNKIDEFGQDGERNNNINASLFFATEGFSLINPWKDQIISEAELQFTAQIINPTERTVDVVLQIDTLPSFSSSQLITRDFQGKDIIQGRVALPPFNYKDFFIRARLKNSLDTVWEVGTFRYIYGSPKGWSQSFFAKFDNTENNFIEVGKVSRNLEFQRTTGASYTVFNAGRNASGYRFMSCDYGLDVFANLAGDGIRVLFINPDNELRYQEEANQFNITAGTPWWFIPGSYADLYLRPGKKTAVYYFNTTLQAHRDSLLSLLERVPKDFHIIAYSAFRVDVDSFNLELVNAFSKFGLNRISEIKNNSPYIGFGQKTEETSGIETFPDLINTSLPGDQQTIQSVYKVFPKTTRGYILTDKIGPSSAWGMGVFGIEREDGDSVIHSVIGIGTMDDEFELITTNNDTINLSTIDANLYPFLKIKTSFWDEKNRTPASIKERTVLFAGVPEGTLLLAENKLTTIDTVQEGEDYKMKFVFRNISDYPFDSVGIKIGAENSITKEKTILIDEKVKGPLAGDTIEFQVNYGTVERHGINSFEVSVNEAMRHKEISLENNFANKKLFVNRDKKSPLINVLIDNREIINGELVSSRPEIKIRSKDENNILLLDKREYFDLKIKHIEDDSFSTLNLHATDVLFTPASTSNEYAEIIYSGEYLRDGVYQLMASVRDVTGNSSASSNYQINFQVVNERAVSNVLFYPNPFSSSASLVFRLSGDVVPDKLVVDIYNIQGRKVKQIRLHEVEEMNIGDNLTNYKWDGTDEFGDKLANGVYFYKVAAETNMEKLQLIKNIEISSEYFKEGFGKVYILR